MSKIAEIDRVNLRQNVKDFKTSPEFDGYTRVVVVVDDDTSYIAGDDTGRTLTVENPWGTQAVANNILAKIKGKQYQPYTSTGAMLHPAVELMDGVVINGLYSGIYNQDITFGHLYNASIAAPHDEEINHEFPYKSQKDRVITRKFHGISSELKILASEITAEVEARKNDVESIKSTLSVQADKIEAKVEKSSGSSSSFGWRLTDSQWEIYSNGATVLKATRNGLEISGKIVAQSGKIGGFTIESNYLSYNNQQWGGTNTQGAYIGSSGIQLGNANSGFRVDMYGNLYAGNGYFRGSVDAGNIEYGGSSGYMSGGGISSHSMSGDRLHYNTISTSYTSGGINRSLGHADYAHDCLNHVTEAEWLWVRDISARKTYTGNLYVGGAHVWLKSKTFTDGSGKKVTITYLGQ